MGKKLYIKDKRTGEFRGSVSDGSNLPTAVPALPSKGRTSTKPEPYPSVVPPKVSLVPFRRGMRFQDWVEKYYDKAWLANRKTVVQNFNNHTLQELSELTPALVEKIESFAKKFDRTAENVYKEARKSRMFAETFAIDPQRQNIYEHLAFHRIGYMKNVSSLIQPPGSGDGAVVIDLATGKLTTRGKLKEAGREEAETTKSVDFAWISHGTVFVASHKYIKEDGGGQRHQRDDIAHFLRAVPETTQYVNPRDIFYHETSTKPMPVIFLGLADGAYYQGTLRNGETRLSKEQRRSNGHNKRVLTMDDLEEFIAEVGRKRMRAKAALN